MNKARGRCIIILVALLGAACASRSQLPERTPGAEPATSQLVDPVRGRRIPMVLYGASPRRPRPLAMISPGYGSRNTDYSFLAAELVRRGYVVAALQHDLEGDPPIPNGEKLVVRRRPFWEGGVVSIRFAAAELRRRGVAGPGKLLLIGHSNGGDMSMLHAATHPEEVSAVFSLDNRRMPLPRTLRPRICSARSSDHPADPGVLPAAHEQERLRMIIVQLPEQRHDDMWDGASDSQKAAMLAVLDRCLKGLQHSAAE